MPWAVAAVGIAASVAGTAVSAYGAKKSGDAAEAQYRANAEYYRYLAGLTEKEAEITGKIYELKTKNIQDAANTNVNLVTDAAANATVAIREKGAAVSGAQTASLAAKGISGVTAEDIAVDTIKKVNRDEMAIRAEADLKNWQILREAKGQTETLSIEKELKLWDLTNKKINYEKAAVFGVQAANEASSTTILNTASQITSGVGNIANTILSFK